MLLDDLFPLVCSPTLFFAAIVSSSPIVFHFALAL